MLSSNEYGISSPKDRFELVEDGAGLRGGATTIGRSPPTRSRFRAPCGSVPSSVRVGLGVVAVFGPATGLNTAITWSRSPSQQGTVATRLTRLPVTR